MNPKTACIPHVAAALLVATALGEDHAPPRPSSGTIALDSPVRRELVAVRALWPYGRIPYEIDIPFIFDNDPKVKELRARLQAAIDEWNSLSNATGVTLVHDPGATIPTPGAPPAVLFQYDPQATFCSSDEGPPGGWPKWRADASRWVQGLLNIPSDPAVVTLNTDCPVSTIVHEIGHAAGLRHEHQRTDRDRFLSIRPEQLERIYRGDYGAPGTGVFDKSFSATLDPVDGMPFDYRSAMHYHEFFETAPPGIPIAQGGPGTWLSQGDISGLARLYGSDSGTTIITTNPPGLEVVVDGARVPTPAAFAWEPGSTHISGAPLAQFSGRSVSGSAGFELHAAARYLFGNWGGSGEGEAGSATIEITADKDSTWFQANFVEQPWDGIRHASPWVERPPCRTEEQE